MSLLTTFSPTPSRIIGLYRYLLRYDCQERENIEKILAPDCLPRRSEENNMIKEVISEAVKLKLLIFEGSSKVRLNPELPEQALNIKTGEAFLPRLIAQLIFDQENQEQHDLARVIAWYLAQNIYNAPGNWDQTGNLIAEQMGTVKLEMSNNARYGQFEDWICFLELGWMHSCKGRSMLVPDPTRHIRKLLPEIFWNPKEKLTVVEVAQRLAGLCPVLETGAFRDEIEKSCEKLKREVDHLSTTTSHAWFRLEEEGYVNLISESDAHVFVFPDGNGMRRISHIQYLQRGKGVQ